MVTEIGFHPSWRIMPLGEGTTAKSTNTLLVAQSMMNKKEKLKKSTPVALFTKQQKYYML
jgi:hypothetical protein